MKMYVWSSEALSSYRPGTIAAMGNTVGEARNNIRKQLKAEKRDEEYCEMIESDTASKPKIQKVLFINGSD